MKTDALILMLANGSAAVDSGAATRRFAQAIMLSLVASLTLMSVALGPLPNLGDVVLGSPKFWMKVAFSASLAITGYVAVARLARPGVRLGWVPLGAALPIVAIWVLTAVVLDEAAPDRRLGLLLGQTWMICPFLIAMLASPVLVATFWALRNFAPTRLPLTGAAAGLFSGAVGALVYALHCPEMEAPFIGTWYLLGILIATAAGASLGRTWLRW